ncbi:MAG: hypothetical protein BGO55_08945 [Sphingobacteriales bacterium 50-39]|nr:MAG: hypothetical protein BGO55_08945 [Sphingobacteriales bacterium 50-39]
MKPTCFLLLSAIHCLVLFAQPLPHPAKANEESQDALERLLNDYYYNHQWQEDNEHDRTIPAFTFQTYINHATTLKELYKIQRKVRRHLGVNLTYRHIEYDSSGLTRISVEAKSRTGKCGVFNLHLSENGDYGVFAVTYQGQRRWFIGIRSEWQECFHDLLTSR